MQGYEQPVVRDFGGLAAITGEIHLLLAQGGGADLSFSSPGQTGEPNFGGSGPGGAPGAEGPVPDGQGVGDTDVSGGSDPGGAGGGGAGSGGSGGGGSDGGGSGGGGGGADLPFTGFAAGVAAAVGSGMAVAGGALRRFARRQR